MLDWKLHTLSMLVKTRITISAENKQGNTGVQIRVGNLFACIVDTGTITTVGTEPIVSIVVVTVQ